MDYNVALSINLMNLDDLEQFEENLKGDIVFEEYRLSLRPGDEEATKEKAELEEKLKLVSDRIFAIKREPSLKERTAKYFYEPPASAEVVDYLVISSDYVQNVLNVQRADLPKVATMSMFDLEKEIKAAENEFKRYSTFGSIPEGFLGAASLIKPPASKVMKIYGMFKNSSNRQAFVDLLQTICKDKLVDVDIALGVDFYVEAKFPLSVNYSAIEKVMQKLRKHKILVVS